MRTSGSPEVLEYRRLLAAQRLCEGYSQEEVAAFLDVDPRTVRRWKASFERQGLAGLAARPVAGRPPKLTATQEKIVRRWLGESPLEHGFATELWTAPHLACLIEQAWDIVLHPRYLCAWLRERGFTPQLPRRIAREGDDEAIAAWLAQDWPRIKKKPADRAHTCCCWMRAGS